jgi:hypothetical protein
MILTVPSATKTAVTGLLLAGDRPIRGAHWRAEAHKATDGGVSYSLWRDGVFMPWDKAHKGARKLAFDLADYCEAMRADPASRLHEPA